MHLASSCSGVLAAGIFMVLNCGAPLVADELKSGEYFVTQSWSQEKNFRRPYFVQVPIQRQAEPFPVLVFLHGNGGSGQGGMRGFLRKYPTLAKRFITVFPDGYLKSWNIVSERSKANDLAFLEEIILRVLEHENAQADQVTVMGSSNGSALANQMAIETKLTQVRNYVTCVSPLNAFQHDGKNFKSRGPNNRYLKSAEPRTGIRLLNVSGENDPLVPYQGGASRGIPAPGGKLRFVPAEESIFLWAKSQGYDGEKKGEPSEVRGPVEKFVYLNGDVVHLKVRNAGHDASRALSEAMLLEFLKVDPRR